MREKKVLLNLALIAERRAALGLSRTQVAIALGASHQVMSFLEKGENHEVLSLSLLHRLATVLEVSLASLFATDGEAPAAGPDDRIIEAALATQRYSAPREDLATALGWELPRVVAALDRLDERLLASGTQLHRRANGNVTLAPRTELLCRGQVVVLERTAAARKGLSKGAARMLYGAVVGTVAAESLNPGWNRRVDLATLLKQGIAITDRSGGIALTEDVRFSLLLD